MKDRMPIPTIESLIVNASDLRASYDYSLGATTMTAPEDESLLGYPVKASSLANERATEPGVPDTPDYLLRKLIAQRHDLIATTPSAPGVSIWNDSNFRKLSAKTEILAGLVIDHPNADPTEISQLVHERFVEPQLEILGSNGHVEEDPRRGLAETAEAGMELFDQLSALVQPNHS